MAKTLQEVIAGEVRAELARQGLTQEELARRLDERQPWVSKRLTGRVTVDAIDVERIADALGVPVTNFLPVAERAA